ncbi:glycopeptide antibiotics resistance protein [Lapidilactobacillus dextrinicus DSM 20335]|uniref:Glycopeptide antibiotics resistance protein n=1 Tax=Lapidilactobacillus dextrinicus DSM 20335 TaxID=1423738 RepID=A0A0R2BH53_9LACO|nr:VanZ family protein [Lapidilactobacillus dextrinicus]KRM78641.1 glycopeptide antibiotics resistance protein [Lapidilactobacillus dextrinicus DSM 20335]QFG46574.1 hypothetical protein LH506_03565 [Lapidilactobacillus dextrinicus]
MGAYITPITTAMVLFPFLAALAVVPYALYQYRKYGSISKLKLLVVFSFIFYLLCAYFLIILPLPSRLAVAQLTTPRYNLLPFTAARQFFNTTVLNLMQPSTYLAAIRQPGFIQPFFNLVLTVPFGLFLRYIWGVSFKKVVLASFCLSLFFELTQLSGLYFIYPRSYRLFDVDDLILNTSGGLVGYLIEPIFVKIFPTITELNQEASSERAIASFWRRFLALVIDLFLFNLLFSGVNLLIQEVSQRNYGFYLLGVLLYFVLVPYFNQGATIGKKIVKIKVVGLNDPTLKLGNLLLRQVLLYGVVLGNLNYLLPQLLKLLTTANGHHVAFYFTLIAFSAGFLVLCGLNVVVLLFKKNSRMFYERLTKTKEIGY